MDGLVDAWHIDIDMRHRRQQRRKTAAGSAGFNGDLTARLFDRGE